MFKLDGPNPPPSQQYSPLTPRHQRLLQPSGGGTRLLKSRGLRPWRQRAGRFTPSFHTNHLRRITSWRFRFSISLASACSSSTHALQRAFPLLYIFFLSTAISLASSPGNRNRVGKGFCADGRLQSCYYRATQKKDIIRPPGNRSMRFKRPMSSMGSQTHGIHGAQRAHGTNGTHGNIRAIGFMVYLEVSLGLK